MEKRNSSRHKTEQSIVCTYFASRSYNDSFGGKMKNYCDAGLYAELQTQLKDGTVLLVRATSNSSKPPTTRLQDGFRSISLVEVKWSKPILCDGNLCYGTGLKHVAI
ncbi:MAG: hypothetical protein ACM3KE_04830 [Hyphomicrobiales bacterium]